MAPEEADEIVEEIEKLKLRKVKLTNNMNMTISFDDKEDLKQDIARINEQIDILEKFKKK